MGDLVFFLVSEETLSPFHHWAWCLLVGHVWALSCWSMTSLWTSQVVQWQRIHAIVGDARDSGSIPGSGRSPGVGNGNPPQCSCLGNSTDTGAWQATARRAAESDTTDWLSTQPHTCPLFVHFLESFFFFKSWMDVELYILKNTRKFLLWS